MILPNVRCRASKRISLHMYIRISTTLMILSPINIKKNKYVKTCSSHVYFLSIYPLISPNYSVAINAPHTVEVKCSLREYIPLQSLTYLFIVKLLCYKRIRISLLSIQHMLMRIDRYCVAINMCLMQSPHKHITEPCHIHFQLITF